MLQVLESDPSNLYPELHKKETLAFTEYGPLSVSFIWPFVIVGATHVIAGIIDKKLKSVTCSLLFINNSGYYHIFYSTLDFSL